MQQYRSGRSSLRKFILVVTHTGKNTNMSYGANKASSLSMSDWAQLADHPTDKIQDLDPLSATFGQFFFMVDYDSV